jgi:hypothetical protein
VVEEDEGIKIPTLRKKRARVGHPILRPIQFSANL